VRERETTLQQMSSSVFFRWQATCSLEQEFLLARPDMALVAAAFIKVSQLS
jgi:hypothetical protein